MDTGQEIEKLKIVSDQHKRAIETELKDLIEQSKKIVVRILLIGGGLALAYLLVKAFVKGEEPGTSIKPREENTPSTFSEIRNFVLAELATFLLTLAKEKLTEYLEETKPGIHATNTEDA